MTLTGGQAALSGAVTTVPDCVTAPSEAPAGDAVAERARGSVSALYQARGEEFFHYAVGLGRDEELARDAVQEAFMRYFVALYEGNHIASPRAWVYRVLHNYLLDRIKERRKRGEHSFRDALDGTQTINVESDYLRKDIFRRVRRTLTDREYECFRLRTEGLRYEEIAAKLHLASGTVGALLCRAIRKTRTILAGVEDASK